MRALQKLFLNGNSTVLTIPRPILITLGWLTGDVVVVELLEDKTLRVRPFKASDIVSARGIGVLHDTPAPVAR